MYDATPWVQVTAWPITSQSKTTWPCWTCWTRGGGPGYTVENEEGYVKEECLEINEGKPGWDIV